MNNMIALLKYYGKPLGCKHYESFYTRIIDTANSYG